MNKFIFDLQRFADVTIAAGESYSLDGVTYTATTDSVLNLDFDNKVSGIASGKVTAVVTGMENSPSISFDATEKSLAFTLKAEDGALVATNSYGRERTITLTEGTLSVEGYNIVAGAAKFFLNSSSGRNYTFESENSATYSIDDGVFTAASDNLKITVSEGTSSSTALELSGKVTRVLTENSYTLNKDTTVSFATEHSNWTLTSIDDNSGSISLSTSGIQITSENEGALSIKSKNDESNYVNFTNITGTINFTGTGFTLNDGSTLGGEWSIKGVKKNPSFVTEGGTATITFSNDGSITSAASNDAKITVNLDNWKMIVHSGSVTDNLLDSTFSLSTGSVIEIDGVTYTALDGDAVLNLDDRKISGIASGKVVAVVAGLENSPTATFDATDGELNFTASGVDGAFVITGSGFVGYTLSSGSLTMSAVEFEGNAGVQKLSFTKDSSISLVKDGRAINVVFKEDSAFYRWIIDKNIIYCALDGDSADFDVSLALNGKEIIGNTVTFGGTMSYSPAQGTFALINDGKNPDTKDSFASFNLGNYKVQVATDGKRVVAGLKVADDGTISINYPLEDYNKTHLTISSGDTPIFDSNLSISDGSIGFNHTTKEISFTKGTEMQIDFGDGYIVNFKTTDDAGGKLSLDADGLNFTPTEGDGHLELSVTRGDETRTTSLEMTGSLTYKLDGSISLAKDTVLKNVFEDGNILTITANTDASGSIIFTPQNGLTITPATPNALNIKLTTGDVEVANISSITGTINYKGGLFTASDGAEVNVLYYNGEYNINIKTTGNSSLIQFDSDRVIGTANKGATLVLNYLNGPTWNIHSETTLTKIYDAEAILSEGANFDTNDNISVFTLGAAGNYTLNGINVTTTKDNTQVKLSNYDTIIVDGISYTPLDDNVTLTIGDTGATCAGGKVTMQMEGFDIALSEDVTDGSISYDSTTNKFTVKAGTKSYIGEGNFPDQFVAKNDFDISVTKTDDGKFKFSLGDESVSFDLTRNGTAIMSSTITLDGSILVDPTNNEISLPKDTVLTMTPGTGKTLQMTALDDAGGELTFANGGLRFKPNENDGALEFNFVDAERKATLDVTGAFTYKGLGALSLEDGTVANLTWTDGTELKITSSGSTGSIGIDPDKGIKITSDDENLDMTLTTPYMSTDISGIKGTIYYKEGNVSFDENSKITATTTLGGQPILTTLETIDGTGHISFSGTTNGIVYSADTGAMKITWSRDDLESTFVVNKGSIQIGHNLFRIAEGSDIATDLKTFVPALYFTTAEAGTYTINGQKITTSAEGLALTATDDQMVFKTSGDVVEYNGMTFAGNGNVSLSSDNVVLGAGVEATGFGEDKSFVLAEAGNVTADAKVFELTEIEGTPREIPMIITVTGAQDGFTFSRTLTKESEAYLDDVLDDEKFADYTSPYIDKVFTEKFISAGDSSYRIRTDAIGLEEVIGISDGATITGGASLADEPTLSYYNLVTDTTGKFTIGERTYNVSGDSSIALRARFEENAAPYASMVDSLNGTISGDFSGGNFSINGSSALKIINDTDISIVADESGYEILGLDAGASLQVAAADTYKVNGTEITAGASSVIVGTADGKASLYTLPAALADFMLHKTEAGYPAMAAVAFHPDEENPAAPTNYHSAEKWTVTSTDDLQLSAMHYSPENPTGKWVILVHGYGKKGAAMNALAEPYLAQGIDVLIVDQRTAGDSEGDWLTMGVAEANDLAIWTQEIAKTNANAQITLHGVSMGAATVMLCAALPETTNVSAMIEDCGYGNIADVFATLLTYYGRSLGVGDVDYYKLFDDVAAVAKTLDGGYDVGNAAPIESIAAVTVPSLFIHGSADVVIPSTNADALYKASGAENKTKLIIEGAGHAKSIEIDTEAYLAAVKKLIDSSTTEIGALIDSNADSKVLRGTIYNDTITNSGTKVTIEALDGDDFITNNVDSSVTAAEFGNLIDMGDGNDTVYNHHSYNPTIYGGAGDDSIVISRGHKTFANGGEGNDSIIGRLADNPDSDWAIGGHATVLGGEDDDYINTGYTNDSSIDGGDGNDTIITCGLNNTIDGGDGKNLINLNVVDREDLSEGSFIVLNGQTTVEGFSTGFGEGSDTVYIEGESPAVDFKAEGLTLYYDNDSTKSLTFAGLSTTDKLNLYYAKDDKTVAEVFIADDEWYSVTADDLSVRDDSELWFVGATAKKNHGIDFGGISDALNITLNTDYEADVENFRINNIHSIKGGAGLTTITGSDKDDTIIAGKGKTTIDGGDGKNLIDLTDSSAAQIVLNGNTTVKGFNTSFGEGSDTIYIDGDPAGVYFKDGVLTFSNSTDSLTLSDVTTTAKVNIYHKRREVLNKGVFIADNDWYSVSSSDLSVSSGEEVYFVGPSATQNHGVDFSGITQDLNVTIDTAYIDSEDYVPTTMWINGVYSLKGGAGNTTITGSDKNDTIIAGTGATTINASEGNDFIRLGSANALVEYSSGDGNDIIEGFRADSTLSIANGSYSSETSGDDVVISVDDGKITLTGAARLSKVNIDGEKDNTGLTLTNSDDIKVTLGSTVKSADAFARTKPIVIVGNDLDNVIKGSKALDLIYGGNGDDSINSGLGNDKIWGCDGDDTLLGNAGNDYLEGGDGNDTIYGGSGTDTLKGDNGDDYLNGNEGNDKLYGGNGSDTLKGGKGNDSLWGNGGADTFIYTKDEGNDIIYGFDDTDMLQITGKFVATYSADNNVISFSIGDTSDAITLKNFTASTFNVNGTAYKISGNTLVKK